MLRNFSSFQSNNEMGKYEKESEKSVCVWERVRERERVGVHQFGRNRGVVDELQRQLWEKQKILSSNLCSGPKAQDYFL